MKTKRTIKDEGSMDRRDFIKLGGAAVAGAGALLSTRPAVAAPGGADPPKAIKRPLKMHLGSQRGASGSSAAATMQEMVRHGVTHWCGSPRTSEGRTYWVPSDIEQVMELAEQNGLICEMVALPLLGSTHIDSERRPAIMLADDTNGARDKDIEDIWKCIEACASAGMPAFKYNMSLLGVIRTGSTPGRGGATYSTFRAADITPENAAHITKAGIVTADMFWERINYFIQKVIPVCDEYKVMAACHPQDPGTPPGGYQGVEENVLSTPGGKGLFKFLHLHHSRYHGLNLCCGCLAEMLWDPPREIYDIFRKLLRTERVFNIHLRNIIGRRDDFQEVYPDNGDVDLTEMVQIMAEEEYPYSIDPDHVPSVPGVSGASNQGYAYEYGCLKSYIQAVDSMSPPHGEGRR